MEHQNNPQPANARACEVFSQGEWVLYPLALAAEAIERGWQVRYLVPHEEQPAAEPVPSRDTLTKEVARIAGIMRDCGRYVDISGHGWRTLQSAAAMLDAASTQQPQADVLIRQYVRSLMTNNPDAAVEVTKSMVDYALAVAPSTITAPQLEAAQALIDQQAAQALGKEGGAA